MKSFELARYRLAEDDRGRVGFGLPIVVVVGLPALVDQESSVADGAGYVDFAVLGQLVLLCSQSVLYSVVPVAPSAACSLLLEPPSEPFRLLRALLGLCAQL